MLSHKHDLTHAHCRGAAAAISPRCRHATVCTLPRSHYRAHNSTISVAPAMPLPHFCDPEAFRGLHLFHTPALSQSHALLRFCPFNVFPSNIPALLLCCVPSLTDLPAPIIMAKNLATRVTFSDLAATSSYPHDSRCTRSV